MQPGHSLKVQLQVCLMQKILSAILAGAMLTTIAHVADAAPKITRSSQRAATVKMGMTYRQVIGVMNRIPNTVRREADLLTYEWQNDTLFCQPISVQLRANQVTGWNEGRTCVDYPSSMNKPAGESCKNNKLCKP